ncbi:MAG: effector-associated domain EAD1-containing protein [Truepera sp.]|nr:effector-associated domain EAD1-containing protein [Truepera sp.]
MQIEQALYGECRGGHSLLVSSGDDAVSAAIVQRLDLPDTAPPNVEWSPFLRGFPYLDRYVLSRTFHDTGASRGGMVFSHALLAPLDELAETSDLQPLLKLLATSDEQRPDATTVRIPCTETPIPQAIDLIDAAEALGARGTLPVVRLGHVGFDDLVVALWANLPPEIRRGFAFRLSFGPPDLVEQPMPALVCTPRGLAARWSEYPVIRAATPNDPGSLASAILSGHARATPLTEFMQQMEVKPATLRNLRLAEQAYLLHIGEPTLERRAGVMRLIEKLSPDSDAGSDGKDLLVRRLCDALSGAAAEEILRLRNLQLSAFPAPTRVWKTLEGWVAGNSFARDQDVDMLSVLEDATTSHAAVQDWRGAIRNGLAVAARSARSSFPRAFWRWTRIRLEIVTAVFPHVPAEAGVEERLASATPRTLDEAAAGTLEPLALSRGWLRLHGTVLSASASALDAARRQVAVDTGSSFVEGLRAALRSAKPAELVECALEIEDPRMPRLAGEAVARDPKLLAGLDLTPTTAQAIWREALAIEPESWQGPTDPAAAFHSILDRLLDGSQSDPMLLEQLSGTPVADLANYPRRPEIWSRIGDGARRNLLTATANGWLNNAASAGIPFVPEHDLQTALLEADELERTLDALIPDRVGSAVRIVTALSQYDQQRFLQLLTKLTSRTMSLPTPDAKGIGRLVLERQWEDVAAYLLGQFKSGRRDLKPALRACCDMLDRWGRFIVGLVPISESEKWEAFQELAAELYPGGPDEDGLWERAGADDADLSTSGDGRTRWRNAIRKMRNGKGPTPSALLARMKEDFPNNERILHLAGDPIFGGSVVDDVRDA